MPRMPQVPDSRHAVTSDPRGVGGLVLGRLFVEGAVSGVALRPAESRGMQVTVGYVTWF